MSKTDELDELAQEVMRKVRCQDGQGCAYLERDKILGTKEGSVCSMCNNTGEILDPQLANLRAVPWVECEGCIRKGKHLEMCTGFDRLKWAGLPKGALTGALAYAVNLTVVQSKNYNQPLAAAGAVCRSLLRREAIEAGGDPDAAAVSVVLAAAKVKA